MRDYLAVSFRNTCNVNKTSNSFCLWLYSILHYSPFFVCFIG